VSGCKVSESTVRGRTIKDSRLLTKTPSPPKIFTAHCIQARGGRSAKTRCEWVESSTRFYREREVVMMVSTSDESGGHKTEKV